MKPRQRQRENDPRSDAVAGAPAVPESQLADTMATGTVVARGPYRTIEERVPGAAPSWPEWRRPDARHAVSLPSPGQEPRGGFAAPVRVREAREADAPYLGDLWAASTSAGGTAWSVRPREGFAALRAEAGDWRVAIAQDDSGEIVGTVSVAYRAGYLDGHPRPTCYGTNFFVRRDWRGRGIGDALFLAAAEYSVEMGGESVPVLLVVREGNGFMGGRIKGPRGLPRLEPVARLDSNVVNTRRAAAAPPPPDVDVRRATASDLEAMAALGARIWPEQQFAPALGAAELARWIAATPGLQLEDFLIARADRQMVGWMGWWDDQAFRDVRVVGRTRIAAARSALCATRARLTGASLPPRIGDRVGTLLALLSCVPASRPDALRALIINAARRRQSECAWMRVALDERDPLRGALRGLGTQVTRQRAYVSTPRGAWSGPPLLDRPLHFDIARA